MGLSAICEALFFHFLCFLFLRPWKLRLNPCHCRLSSRSSFISLSLLWTVLPTLGGRMFFLFFFYECQSPSLACEGCQCCNRRGIYRSLSFRVAHDASLTEEDVRDPASIGSSASSFIGRAQITRRELTFTIFIHRIFC